VTAVEAIGDGRLQAVRWRRGGRWRELPVRHLLLHQGVVPQLNLIRLAGCEVDWHAGRHCWEPQTDAWGRSSVPGIWIAGDGAGIAGAAAAPHQGRIAAAGIAAELDRIAANERDAAVRRSRDELRRLTRFRRFVDGLYRPDPAFLVPDAATLACRCEEVSGDEVRAAVREGCHGVDAIKQYTRSGMGACQGRMCALTVAELIAEVRGISPAEAGCPTQRSPAKPLPLPTLARLSARYEATVPERVA